MDYIESDKIYTDFEFDLDYGENNHPIGAIAPSMVVSFHGATIQTNQFNRQNGSKWYGQSVKTSWSTTELNTSPI